MNETNLSVYVPALEWLGIEVAVDRNGNFCIIHLPVTGKYHIWTNQESPIAVFLILDKIEEKGHIYTLDNMGFDNQDQGKHRTTIGYGPEDAKWEPSAHGDGPSRTIAVLEALKALYEAQVKEAGE